jgi:ribonuclease P protein component
MKSLTKSEIAAVFKDGQKYHSKYFTLVSRKLSSDDAKMCISISKKSGAKTAVLRNKLKRQMRDIIKSEDVNYDFVIILKTPALKLSFNELEKAYSEIKKKVK